MKAFMLETFAEEATLKKYPSIILWNPSINTSLESVDKPDRDDRVAR